MWGSITGTGIRSLLPELGGSLRGIVPGLVDDAARVVKSPGGGLAKAAIVGGAGVGAGAWALGTFAGEGAKNARQGLFGSPDENAKNPIGTPFGGIGLVLILGLAAYLLLGRK